MDSERDDYADGPPPLPTPCWVKDMVYPALAAVLVAAGVVVLLYFGSKSHAD